MSTIVKFESPRYKSLGFYVGDVHHVFINGTYTTDDPAVIAALDALTTDVSRLEETEIVPEKPVVTRKPKSTVKDGE